MSKKIELHKDLFFTLALYEDGSFQKGKTVDEGFVMLIDLGRKRNTIMSNPTTTPNAINAYGYYWEEFEWQTAGDDIVIDDDFIVHYNVKAVEEDYENVKDGIYSGIIKQYEGGFTYMDKNGNFENI
jgi:hypothetical protein